MSENKRTVERYMDAYARWDHDAILACLADDVEWLIPGAFHIAGKSAFDREVEGEGSAGPPSIDIARLTEESDIVIAEGSVRARRTGGASLHLAFCDVFEMRQGLIARLISYLVPVPEQEATRPAAKVEAS